MPGDGDFVPIVSYVPKGAGESAFPILLASADAAGPNPAEFPKEAGIISGFSCVYVGKESEAGAGNCELL